MLAHVFERFTERARHVIVLAQEEARILNHNYIGTEHLLLGLVREEEGVAAQALRSLDLSLDVIRQNVEEIIGTGRDIPTGHIPFTPRAKKVMELSLREALQLRHNYIGTEHILLGLIREGEGVAAQVLRKLGADFDAVRKELTSRLSGQRIPESRPLSSAEVGPLHQGRFTSPRCPKCGTDVSQSAAFLARDVEDVEGVRPRPFVFVFCRECGVTLGVRIDASDSAREAEPPAAAP
jgi:ATP-dependent Clp protease ATP-binding subunit ClpC